MDRVLDRLGEDCYYDSVQDLDDVEDERAGPNDSSDEISGDVAAAVAGYLGNVGAATEDPGEDQKDVDQRALVEVPLSASQADSVHQVEITIAALQATINSLKAIGSVRSAQCVEQELQKERRKQRALCAESPAVADAFLRFRRAEEQETLMQRKQAAQLKDKKREAEQVRVEQNTAVAEIKRIKRDIQDMESVRASRHAINTFTLQALGADRENAGALRERKPPRGYRPPAPPKSRAFIRTEE